MTAVYLAGRFDRKDEIAGYAAELRELGYTVTSRWLTDAHQWSGTDDSEIPQDELWTFAMEDFEDLNAANLLIAFTEDRSVGYTSGGRHVELGYALAQPLDVIVVGPRENIFHACLSQYDTWPEALARLSSWVIDVVATCRECGCTDDYACEGGCYWVEPDLCSACAEMAVES